MGLVQQLLLFLLDARLRYDPGGAHRRARVRAVQIVRGAELDSAQPPRTSSAVVRHREGVCV